MRMNRFTISLTRGKNLVLEVEKRTKRISCQLWKMRLS